MKLSNTMTFVRPFAIAALATCSIAGMARAQESAAPHSSTNASLTVDALVDEALRQNQELKFCEVEIAAAKGDRRQAAAFPNPEVSGEFGRKRVNAAGLSGEGNAWSVSVMQPFEWPGRIGLRKAIANHDIELAQLGCERFRAALTGRVRSLSYRLFAAQEKAAAAREVAERFQALREMLVTRDPAGLTPLLETRVIEATELTAQRKATEAALAMNATLFELNQLRGASPDQPLVISNTELAFDPLPDPETLLAIARTNNFELRLRAVELAQQGFRVALAKNERYPSLAVGPTYSEENAADRERIIGVGVSLPLPFWNRNNGAIDAAKARQTQAEVSLAVTQRETGRQVSQAIATYQAKVREMNRWRPDSIQHFKEAAELSDRHYRLGAVPIATYVELQEKYLAAVEGLLDTKREALDAAQEIHWLTGTPAPLVRTTAAEENK